MKLLIGLVATGAITAAGLVIASDVQQAAQRSAADSQARLVSTRAFIESEYGYTDWESALETAVASLRDPDGTVSLDGTTVYVRFDEACYLMELPDPLTVGELQTCG